jgi:hypothetical protein
VKETFYGCAKITVADLIKKLKDNKKIQAFFDAIRCDINIKRDTIYSNKSQGVFEELKVN